MIIGGFMDKETLLELKKYFQDVDYNIKKDISLQISNEFATFQSVIAGLPILNEHLIEINKCCDKIEKVSKEYENGNISKSSLIFNELMKDIKSNLESIIINNKNSENFLNKHFYRMRYSDSLLTTRKEIFHIPLSLRRKIKLQRYNIPGLPALFLSSSIYTCWVEMDKPNIQDLHVSRFMLDKSKFFSILNFTMIDPKRLFYKDQKHTFHGNKKMYCERQSDDFLIDAMILWPLLFACSLKGSNKNDFFKPEYIMPQFLIEWSRTYKNLDGIAYFSVDLDTSNIDPYYAINYVFPVKNVNNEICSNLADIFEFTKPLRFDVLENSSSVTHNISPALSHRKFQDNDYNGYPIYYENTKYGNIENYLQAFETGKIKI